MVDRLTVTIGSDVEIGFDESVTGVHSIETNNWGVRFIVPENGGNASTWELYGDQATNQVDLGCHLDKPLHRTVGPITIRRNTYEHTV